MFILSWTLRRHVSYSKTRRSYIGAIGSIPWKIHQRSSIRSVLLNAIVDYPNSHRLIFGVNSVKKSTPVLVKKSLLVLIASGLLGYKISSVVKDVVTTHGEMYAHFGFFWDASGVSTDKLKITDYFYWTRIRTKS